jgi:hypothetical protein
MLLHWQLAVEQTSVEEAIRGVKHPYGDEHRDDGRQRKADMVGGRDKPYPESCNGRSVEREKMPEDEQRAAVFGVRL